MKVVNTLVICSLLVASQAFAQATGAARAGRAGKDAGRITAPKAGGKLSEGTVGTSAGSAARPNLGAAGKATGSADVLGAGVVGGTCGGDLSPAEQIIVKEARAMAITSPAGGCLDKLSGEPKKVGVKLLAGAVEAARRAGVTSILTATTAQRAVVYDGAGEAVGAALKINQAEGLNRVESLCSNSCNVTFCDSKALAAAKVN